MSDREEIDVIKSDDKSGGKDTYSSDNNDQAIRQDPLTHSNKKIGLLEKLKRAFSTEDTYFDDENADSDFSEGLDDTEENIFKSIINKVSKSVSKHEAEVEEIMPSDEVRSEPTEENKSLDTEEKAEQPQNIDEPVKEPEPDPEEEAEFAMINAILDGESIDDMEFPDDKADTEEKPLDSTEEKAEEKPLDSTEEKAEEKPLDRTESKAEEKPLDSTEEKAEEKPLDSTEKTAEEKPLDSTEEKAEEKPLDSTESKADNKNEYNSEAADDFDDLDIVIEEEDIQDLFNDEDTEFVFAEFDVDDESGGVESIEIDDEPSAQTETVGENTDTKSAETAEQTPDTKNESEPKSQTADTDDEEVAVDDEFLFDETQDEVINSDKEDNSANEEKSEQDNTPVTEGENNPEQENTAVTEEENNPEQENTVVTEGENNPEQVNTPVTEEENNPEQENTAVTEGESNPEQENTAVTEGENNPEQENTAVTEGENNPEQENTSSVESTDKKSGRFKEFYSKAKNKLTVMWNTMDDGTVQQAENKVSLVKEDKIKEEITAEESDSEPVPVIDSEPEPVLNLEPPEDSEQQYGEDLYKNMFGGESELDKYRRQLYGDDYKDEVENEDSVSSFFEVNSEEEGTEQSTKPFVRMTVIRNDAPEHIDRSNRAAVRETLNVIEQDPREAVLTEADIKQEEKNRQVLEKVQIFDEEYAQRREQHAQEREERKKKNAALYEKQFGAVKHISEIEVYDYEYPDQYEYIKVKAGLFSESVKTEYDFYLGYSKLQNVAKRQLKIDSDSSSDNNEAAPAKEPDAKGNTAAVRNDDSRYSSSSDTLDDVSRYLEDIDRKNPDLFEYRNEDEAGEVRHHIHDDLKRYKSRFRTEALLTAVMLVLCLLSSKFSVGGGENTNGTSVRLFAFINFVVYTFSVYNVRRIIIHGLKSFVERKANRDTTIALAGAVVWVQSLAAVITPAPFLRQGLTLYSVIIMLVFAVNTYGRYLNAVRMNMNFRFVSDSSQKYIGKFFHDQRMLATLLSGMRNEKSELVFQKKTAFLKHFIKLSKMHDPGEDLAKKFAFPTLIFTVVMTAIYGFLSRDFCETLSFLSIMLCVSVPVCAQTLGALPLSKLSRETLQNQSMVVGYPAVERFADSGAVMLDAKELYPEGSVHLSMLRTFDDRRKDEAVIAAAAIMITAGGAVSGIFDELIEQRVEILPKAENVMYQDGKGLIGWVNGERYFIGNRQLLLSHGIQPADIQYENEQKQGNKEILYLARSGEVIAMFIVTYDANRRVADALRRMEATGMTLLIRTTDANITAERIAADFGVYYKNIKILEQKNANFIRDEMVGKEKSSPAFIATKGGVTSFGRAVSECIQTKSNISLSVAIQIFAILLELLVVSLFGVLARVSIHAMPWVFFSVFWIIAILVGPVIVQKFQK